MPPHLEGGVGTQPQVALLPGGCEGALEGVAEHGVGIRVGLHSGGSTHTEKGWQGVFMGMEVGVGVGLCSGEQEPGAGGLAEAWEEWLMVR